VLSLSVNTPCTCAGLLYTAACTITFTCTSPSVPPRSIYHSEEDWRSHVTQTSAQGKVPESYYCNAGECNAVKSIKLIAICILASLKSATVRRSWMTKSLKTPPITASCGGMLMDFNGYLNRSVDATMLCARSDRDYMIRKDQIDASKKKE
jgi:hypothetical protein